MGRNCLLLAFCVCLAGASLGYGQIVVPPPLSLPGPGVGQAAEPKFTFGLLQIPSVIEELKLDETQQTQLKEIFEELKTLSAEMAAKFRETRQIREEFQRAHERRELEALHKGFSVLYAEQRGRLTQIAYQQLGAQMLMQTDIADDLGLKQRQLDVIRTLHRESVMNREAGRPNLNNPKAEIMADIKQRAAETRRRKAEFNKKALEVLTDEQRAKWESLLGEPFELKPPETTAPNIPPVPAKPKD